MRQELIGQVLGYGLVTYLVASVVLLVLIFSDAQKGGNRFVRAIFRLVVFVMIVAAAVVIFAVLYRINPA